MVHGGEDTVIYGREGGVSPCKETVEVLHVQDVALQAEMDDIRGKSSKKLRQSLDLVSPVKDIFFAKFYLP